MKQTDYVAVLMIEAYGALRAFYDPFVNDALSGLSERSVSALLPQLGRDFYDSMR